MKRNKFSLSHYKLLSCAMGELVPCGLTEVLPGDSFQHSTSLLVRVSPLLRPVMHPVHARVHHFFVPARLLWEDFEDFITGGPDGADASDFPTITFGGGSGAAVGSLADYLGVPTGVNNLEVSALPFRAYAMIFNEWFRDQDLVNPLQISLASGNDTTTSTTLQAPAWEKDYFTSARPWTQKGPEITLPLGGYAPVERVPNGPGTLLRVAGGSGIPTNAGLQTNGGGLGNGSQNLSIEPNGGLRANLATASAASINDLREAFALQRYEENRARYGSRYTEFLAFYGVRSSDSRLQRPEYLGGGKQTIQFSEVLQTAPTTDGDDEIGVGNLKGHGIGALRSNRYVRFFEEHGYVISLVSIQPRTMYMQGIPRTWNRRIKEDFYQKELEHIGQQSILKKELYAQGTSADDEVFGYQDRYDEYRRMESSVSGHFRTTLKDWHYAREFGAMPALNSSFITSNPTNRVYADQTVGADHLWIMAYHTLRARRILGRTGRSFIF